MQWNKWGKISVMMWFYILTFLGAAQLYAYTRDWSVATPIDHTLNREWPEWIRKAKSDIAERFSAIFYGFTAGETDTGVKSLPFVEQSADPSTIANQVQLYGKAVAGKTELFSKDEDGNTTQITSGGSLNVASSIPSGVIWAYAGITTPTGWLVADGSAVSRTTYSDLFAAIGTTYGSGDGSTTFNLPDMQDRLVLGKGSTFSTLGATGGATTKDLSHTHTVTSAGSQIADIARSCGCTTTSAYLLTNSTSVTEGSGGSTTQDIMPPYIVEKFIIKT